jgi:LEA14-like dessication related protein
MLFGIKFREGYYKKHIKELNMKRLLLFSFFLTFFSCVSCKEIIESYAPDVSINHVSFNSISLGSFEIDVYYLIKNYRIKENIKLIKRDYSVYIGDDKISTINENKPVNVPGNRMFLFKETYKIPYGEMLTAIRDSLSEGKIVMRIEGFLHFQTSIGKLKVPIEKSKTVRIPFRPNFSIKEVKIAGYNKFVVTAVLKNKSEKPLEIVRLNFKLYMGTRPVLSGKSGNIYIEAKSKKELKFDVMVNIIETARLIAGLAKIKKPEFKLKGSYILKTASGNITLPIDI